MAPLDKQEPLRGPDHGGGVSVIDKKERKEVERRQTLIAEAAVEVYKRIEHNLPNLAPESRGVIQKAFDRTKNDVLPQLDVEKIDMHFSGPSAFYFVALKLIDELANTAVSPLQFKEFDMVYPDIFELIPPAKYDELLARMKERTGE